MQEQGVKQAIMIRYELVTVAGQDVGGSSFSTVVSRIIVDHRFYLYEGAKRKHLLKDSKSPSVLPLCAAFKEI